MAWSKLFMSLEKLNTVKELVTSGWAGYNVLVKNSRYGTVNETTRRVLKGVPMLMMLASNVFTLVNNDLFCSYFCNDFRDPHKTNTIIGPLLVMLRTRSKR